MTTEELVAALEAGDVDRCRELVTGASEKERRAAAPAAQKWHRAVCAAWMRDTLDPDIPLPQDRAAFERVQAAAAVALAGTATLAELKSLSWRVWHLPEPAWTVLAARLPDVLDDWIEWVLGENVKSWPHVRRWVREGVAPPPRCESYITALIGHMWPDDPTDLLRADPGLREHEVWRLFEVEGGGENSLAARDKYNHPSRTWRNALATLAAEGLLPRERLLDAGLEALERDFERFRAGWFSQFHEALEPTLEEREARAGRYLALLGSRIAPTVSFAMKALTALDKAGRLTDREFVGHAAPALAAREKGTVAAALRLLDRIAKRDPALAHPAAVVAAEALLHEAPEVQGRALDLIEQYGRREDADLAPLLQRRLEDLAPSQRPRLAQWLGAVPETAASDDAEDLFRRAAAVSPAMSALAGLDAAVVAARSGKLDLPPLDLRNPRIPRLDPAAALGPVADLDALIDLFSTVMENCGPPDDIERLLDGLSRLCNQRPPDFDRRTAPLKKRAAALVRKAQGWAFLGWLPRDLPELALAWLTGKVADRDPAPQVDLTWFYGARCWEVAQRAAARTPAVLLAAPTHAGGWLDPRTFVQRVQDHGPFKESLPLFDLIQGLLRLAPDHRAEALAAAADLPGDAGDAIRHALGAEGVKIGPTAALWAAAARARSPFADDAAVAARHPKLGPDAGEAARSTFRLKLDSYNDHGTVYLHWDIDMVVEPPVPEKLREDLPTVMLHAPVETETRERRWLATLWPAGRAAWFAHGVGLLAHNLDWWEAEWQNRVHLEALLEPDTDLGEIGRLLLGLGLGAKEAGEAGLATDAAIMAVADGRIDGPALGATLAHLLGLGVKELPQLQDEIRTLDPKSTSAPLSSIITAARWAKTLAVVSRASPLHAETVRTALEQIFASQPIMRPADLTALLTLFHELSVELGAAVPDPGARAYLATLRSGKSAKLAQALLAVPEGDRAARRQAALLALAGRVERAERWQSYLAG